DTRGGDYMPGPSLLRDVAEEEIPDILTPEQKAKQIGSERFKLMAWPGRDLMNTYTKKRWGRYFGEVGLTCGCHMPTLYRAMITGKPYPVKALLTVWSNPMITQGNIKLVYKGLKSLDLYVVHDYFLTPSADLADYVFPCASWIERPWLWDQYSEDCDIYAGEAGLPSTIPGEYEHRTDYEFVRGLGIRVGQEKYWPWKNLEEVYDWKIEPLKMTFKEFMQEGGYYFPEHQYKKYEKMGGFATPTGKCELYSTIFEKLGYDPLPKYEESFESPISRPDLAKEYPFIFINGGRFLPYFHSEHRQIESIRKRRPEPLVQIHPETAQKMNIQDGDWVWIETLRGKVRMKCQYFDGIDPRVIHAEHGWWFPELPGEEPWLHGVWESNVNVLTEDDPEVCNKISGGWPLKTGLCKIYKVKSYGSSL
ncbi:MAG: molybdopterin dinucleotide binding domain-containing protein, partial [Thermodesulfobacteriota bacterium]|nr:molybdopterin dinucleotide binding domain-containing protein [Thermodesulfobacteriota bacterium]